MEIQRSVETICDEFSRVGVIITTRPSTRQPNLVEDIVHAIMIVKLWVK